MTNIEIAKVIKSQLGGNSFLQMTGTKNLVAIERGLTMRLTKNNLKAKWLKITLNGTDTYDIEFTKEKRTLNKLMYQELGIKRGR